MLVCAPLLVSEGCQISGIPKVYAGNLGIVYAHAYVWVATIQNARVCHTRVGNYVCVCTF
jgi:hypothetical protein